jgi:glycine/D-amino acid oxidase-like deaminating enzyme
VLQLKESLMSATERRDLRTGTPVWDAYPKRSPQVSRLRLSRRADVVIVGAGITGALIAEATTAAGLSTIILDRRPPARGSTAASTALLQFELDTPLISLADHIGFDAAARAWRRSFMAVEGLVRLATDLSINCGLRSRNALYLSGNVLAPGELAREGQARASVGLPSRFLDQAELRSATGITHPAALLSQGAADVNPIQLTHGLLRCAIDRGAALHAPVELAEVVPLRSGVGLVTSDGVSLEVRSLVLATGYELAAGIPTQGHCRTSTWAFATPPQRDLRGLAGAVLWEASNPYLYMRTTTDERLVVGGEDEDFDDEEARDALIASKVLALQQKTQALVPWCNLEVDYSWAGTFGESTVGMPTIGPVPAMPHCYAVLGFGGNGITFGSLAAELIASYLTGKPDPDAGIFAFKS